MTSTHTMQFTLAPANGGGACVSLDLMHRASLALLLVIVTCAPVTLWSAPPDFTSAQSVEAFRVAPRSERNKTTAISFREQKVIAGPRLLSRASSRAIAEQLRRIYGRDRRPTRCTFVARYGLRVRLPRETVEAVVCPHCGEVEFFWRKGRRTSSISSQLLESSVSSELLDILLKTFSDYPLQPDEI